MTADEVIALVTAMPEVVAVAASEANGAPEVAWGDTFVFDDSTADGSGDRRMPFATLVTKDYDGFDTASNLDRPGVFRVNVAVGRERFEELTGHSPAAPGGAGVDYTALDRILPHPVYATQSWVCVLNPAARTGEQLRDLLEHARMRAALSRARRPRRPRRRARRRA